MWPLEGAVFLKVNEKILGDDIMSIKSKWIGLEAYNLKLFLIKKRFFMSGSGIEANTNKLLALGFREVPKSALKEGARSYWTAPTENGFLARVVAAFPEYTVQMLPPEAINPTILVNRNQNHNGGIKNDTREPEQRTGNEGQSVAEITDRNLHSADDSKASVLVGTGTQHDPGAESSFDAGHGGESNLPPLAGNNSDELRGSDDDISAGVDEAQSLSGNSKPAGPGSVAQPSETGQSGSDAKQFSAELGVEQPDERRGELLLGDSDARAIRYAMERRKVLVERLSGDTVSLAQHVLTAIHENNTERHAELRAAYEKLEAQELTFSLGHLFYQTDNKEGIYAALALLGEGSLTVGKARDILTDAGYAWLAEHVEPVFSLSDDVLQENITVDRVKQVVVARFAINSGITGGAEEAEVNKQEVESRIGRAEIFANLMSLGRAAQNANEELDQERIAVSDDLTDAENIKIAFEQYTSAVRAYKAELDDLRDKAEQMAVNGDLADASELAATHKALQLTGPSIYLARYFFEVAGQGGVSRVFDRFDADLPGTTTIEARKVFDQEGYGSLFDSAIAPHSLLSDADEVSFERLKSWIVDALVAADASLNYSQVQNLMNDATGQYGELGSLVSGIQNKLIDAKNIKSAHENYVIAANEFLGVVTDVRDGLARIDQTRDITGAGELVDMYEDASLSISSLNLPNYFFDADEKSGVIAVFDKYGTSSGTRLDAAKMVFEKASYGDLFDSAWSANSLFTASETVSIDRLKFWVLEALAQEQGLESVAAGSVFNNKLTDTIQEFQGLRGRVEDLKTSIAEMELAREQFAADRDAVTDSSVVRDSFDALAADADAFTMAVSQLKTRAEVAIKSQDFSQAAELKATHVSLMDAVARLELSHYFFNKTDGKGVAVAFANLANAYVDGDSIDIELAKLVFQDAGYGDLFESSIVMHSLFTRDKTILLDDLKAVIIDGVAESAGVGRAVDESVAVYDAIEEASIGLQDITYDLRLFSAAALQASEKADDLSDNPSNFRLADFLGMAQVERLENHGRKWDVIHGLYSAFSDADDERGAIADVHRGAVNNAIYFQLPDSNNYSGVPMPRDEVLADYPDLIEKFADVFAVDRAEVAATAVDKGVNLVAAYHVLGSDIYVYESRENDSKIYLLGVVGDDLEVDNLVMMESLSGAISSATGAYTRLNNLGAVIGSDEDLDDAAIIDIAGDGSEPDAGELSAEQLETEQVSDVDNAGASLDIVKRMADMGHPINAALLRPFVGVSEAYRDLVRDTKVLVTSRVLYEGFDTARTDAETQTLVMNAPRPLIGSSDFQADFFDGRYYALVDTAGDSAGFQVENNVKMDAKLPVYMDMATMLALSLQSNRYADEYLSLVESGERSFETVASEAIKNREFTIDSLEAAISSFVAKSPSLSSTFAVDASAVGVDGVDELSDGMRVSPSSAGLSKIGDIVRTEDGGEFLMMGARFDWVEVCPIIDGKSQVSADTSFRFHVNPSNADSYPGRDHRAIFHTGRNSHEEERAQQGLEKKVEPELKAKPVTESEASANQSAEGTENTAPAFINDEDDAVEAREWTGHTLEQLKRAEDLSNDSARSFRGAVTALVKAESQGSLHDMQDRMHTSILSFTGWGGLHETYRMDGRKSYAGAAVSQELGMAEADFHNTIMTNRLESYYTPASVIEAMWRGLQRAGVPASGRYLEPACGSGHFFVGAPATVQASASLVGIDCDPVAARFARVSAPDARIIESRYENVVLDNNFDAVIGNVPFGSTRISDSNYPAPLLIHDYFIKRSLSHLKDSGLMSIITTAGTMDKADDTMRADIMATSDLVAAVRLPSDVFARDNAKVVTDILVFQKRPEGTEPSFDFTATSMLGVGSESFRVNQFFINNPQYVLGEVVTTSSAFGPKMDVDGSLEGIGEKIEAALNEQITDPLYGKTKWVKSKVDKNADTKPWDDGAYSVSPDDISTRIIGEVTILDGKLVEVAGVRPEFDAQGVQVGESVLVADVNVNASKQAILLSYIPLRDSAIELTIAQLAGDDEKIKTIQEQTLALYHAFVKKHGFVNARKVVLAIQDDPRSSEVFALENYDQDKASVISLAETLYKKVVGSMDNVKIETAQDAYYACVDRKGVIDFDYMAQVSGLDADAIKGELLGSLVFLNPKTNAIESSTTYLSGNVVQKLEEAEQAAMFDPQLYAGNIAALNRVRPLLLPFEDISINLGANWIPANDIARFVGEMCGERSVTPREVLVTCDATTGTWVVNALGSFEKNNEIAMRSRFGTTNIKFTKLLEMTLNGKKPSHYYKDSEGKMILDYEATMASRAKQDDIKEAFGTWVSSSDERKQDYARIYNEKINVICTPQADGSRITFPGMSSAWKPRSHQSDMVAMGLMGYNTMAAHPVGAGKTFEMVAMAIKLKQVGMSTKPMISVPNHMLAQMTREAKEIFPSAKVLMVTNDDLSSQNRKRFFAVARNNDWDLIVCTHSMLDRLEAPFQIKMDSVEKELVIANRQLETTESNMQKRNLATKINTLVSKKSKMIADYQESLVNPDKAPMRIEDIGVDTLLVDEAHLYKNLFLNTGMQVLGISQSGSARASNLLEISQYFRELHGKPAGLHFFTGTPIANSVAELYVHNRFLRPDILEGIGVNTFDQWALNFGKTVDKAEVLADGSSIGIRTRFSEFQNLPELIKLFRSFADVRTLAELNLPTPKLNSHVVIVEQTQLGKDHMIHLGIRAVATRNQGKAEKGMDNILNIATDGRKAALDLQMIDHRIPDNASNKLATVAQNIMKEWDATHEQKGAQLVFMDLGTPGKKGATEKDKRFSGYDKLRDILVESGMPRDQIAFIHDAKNDTQKDALFRAVRSGKIRVLIGSTLKMGVGTNVQERLCALHNVDCPWRPDQLEQRIGRIMRQGNLFFKEVGEYRYVTKDSIELFMYQKLETKDRFIKQAMASPDTAERVMVEEVDAGYGDIMASATGEPRIREKFEVDADVERLERRHRSWVREQAYARDYVYKMEKDIVVLNTLANSYQEVQKALPRSTYKAITVRGSVFAVQDGDTTWLSATEAGIAIKTRLDSVGATLSRSKDQSQSLKANIGDLELMVERNFMGEDIVFADLDGRSVPRFSVTQLKNPQSLGRAIRELYNAADVIKQCHKEIKIIEDNIARSPKIQTVWLEEAQYQQRKATKKELDEWFAKQDFDKRFEGLADPFEAKLQGYIFEHEKMMAMSEEDDMEAYAGANTSQSEDLDDEADLYLNPQDMSQPLTQGFDFGDEEVEERGAVEKVASMRM